MDQFSSQHFVKPSNTSLDSCTIARCSRGDHQRNEIRGGEVIHKLIAVILLSTGVAAWGQTPARPQVLVKAGRLFDARNGQIIADQAILVEGDTIKEVGDISTVAVHAPHATVIDFSTATVLPGLIDCHAHILYQWCSP